MGLHGAAFVEQPLAEVLETLAVHSRARDDGDTFTAVRHGLDRVHHERGVLVGYLDVARACGDADCADFLVRGIENDTVEHRVEQGFEHRCVDDLRVMAP